MQIINRANLSNETLTALQSELPRFGTLHEFVQWGSARRPPVLLTETIARYGTESGSDLVAL